MARPAIGRRSVGAPAPLLVVEDVRLEEGRRLESFGRPLVGRERLRSREHLGREETKGGPVVGSCSGGGIPGLAATSNVAR